MRAGARQIAAYNRSRRQSNRRWGLLTGAAVATAFVGGWAFNELDPTGSIPSDNEQAGSIGNEASYTPVLDDLGRDVARECLRFAIEAGDNPSYMPIEEVVDEYAAGCALTMLRMPGDDTAAEALFLQIADGMQEYADASGMSQAVRQGVTGP